MNGAQSPGCNSARGKIVRSKSLSLSEYPFLRDFVSGTVAKLCDSHQEWASLAEGLSASVDAEVDGHLKACSRCRAFSILSENIGLKRPPLSESSVATLCKDCLFGLNRHVEAALVRERQGLLQSMADSLGISLAELQELPSVADRCRDCSLMQLVDFTAERDRVLKQADAREQLLPVFAYLLHVRKSVKLWRSAVASRFEGNNIPHNRNSVITGADVDRYASQWLRDATVSAASEIEAWEGRWPSMKFKDVFCIFGVGLPDKDDVRVSPDAEGWAEAEPSWIEALEDQPLHDEDLEEGLKPMQVAVRVRPPLDHEAGDEITAWAKEDGVTMSFRVTKYLKDLLNTSRGHHTLQFDAALQGSQAALFSRSGIKALVHKACEGYTSTVFAYGQTGAGKTYSLIGRSEFMTELADDNISDAVVNDLPLTCRDLVDQARRAKVCGQGLLPRAMQFLFKVLDQRGGSSNFTIRVTFMELYNEKIFDLLNPGAAQLDLRQRSLPEQGFYVPGLTSVECPTPVTLLKTLRQGISLRHTAGHSASRESSRAHAIFTVEIEGRECGGQVGKLIFADLAGSERMKRIQGADQQETSHINRSLLMLSNCVSALSAGETTSTISSAFRNSKLTKVLMESLGGNGYTLVIAAVSPAQRHYEETANTLFFAAKCANITRQLVPNLTAHEREVRDLKDTIESLREELADTRRSALCYQCGGFAYPQGSSAIFDVASIPGTSEVLSPRVNTDTLRRELHAERQRNKSLMQEMEALKKQVRRQRSPPKQPWGANPVSSPSSPGGSLTLSHSASHQSRARRSMSLDRPQVRIRLGSGPSGYGASSSTAAGASRESAAGPDFGTIPPPTSVLEAVNRVHSPRNGAGGHPSGPQSKERLPLRRRPCSLERQQHPLQRKSPSLSNVQASGGASKESSGSEQAVPPLPIPEITPTRD